jgi:hypothetical protein
MVDIKLFGLYVYDKESGVLLYYYEFEHVKFEKQQLIGGFLKSVDHIFKEILSSDQPLKQVIHGTNYILFNEGINITAGLFTNLSTVLTNNWLYRFRVDFERNFEDIIGDYKETNSCNFGDKPVDLVKSIFYIE